VISRFRRDMKSKYGSTEITNQMQPCNRIYYSKVYWGLNMFRAAHRSSSGALNSICSLWFTWWPAVVKAQPLQRPVTACVHKTEAANTV